MVLVDEQRLERRGRHTAEDCRIFVEQRVDVAPQLRLRGIFFPEQDVAGSSSGRDESCDHKSSNERAHRALLFMKTSAKVHLT